MPPRLPLDVAGSARISTDALSAAGQLSEARAIEYDTRADADDVALLLYAPPRVLVDADGFVLDFFGDTSPFLAHLEGRATFDILEMVRPELLLDLREALDAARKGAGPSRREATFASEAGEGRVSVEATPLDSPPGAGRLLVAFREVPSVAVAEPGTADEDLARLYEAREERLHRELNGLRNQLRSMSEQEDRSGEALRAANEEVRSSNEELQSINEELETSSEELQSTNEELITVNDELLQNNRELALANDDIENFISSTEIPVLMLDCDLNVRRFTPPASRIVRILPTDEGRPLHQLGLRIDAPDLEDAVRSVIDSGEEYRRDVMDETGHWYSMQILPYRSGAMGVEGAVVTFVDIDELKSNLERAERRAELANALADADANIASATEFRSIMQSAIDGGVRALHIEAGIIEIQEGGSWVVGYQFGFRPRDVGERSDAPQSPLGARAAETLDVQVDAESGSESTEQPEWLRAAGARAVIAVPLVTKGAASGCITFFTSGRPRPFSAAELQFSARLAASVSLALENARLLEREHHAVYLSATLNKINEILMSDLTVGGVLAGLVGDVSDAAGADKSLVIEVSGERFTVLHVRGVSDDLVGEPKDATFYPAFALAARTRRPVLIGDTWNDPRTNKDFVKPNNLRAFQLIPLIVDDVALGVLALAFDAPREFDAEDQEFSDRTATAMSLALKNARLYEAERARQGRPRCLPRPRLFWRQPPTPTRRYLE